MNEIIKVPVVALRGLTIFPGMVIHFDLNRRKSIDAASYAITQDQRLFVITQKQIDTEEPTIDELYSVGTLVMVKQITKLPNHIVRVLVEGVSRAKLLELSNNESTISRTKCVELATIEVVKDVDLSEQNNESEEVILNETAMLRMIMEQLTQYVTYFPKIGQSLTTQISEDMDLGMIIDKVAMNIPIPYEKKQQVLEALITSERYQVLSKILMDESKIAEIREKLAQDIKGRVEKNQKDYILREQLAFIKKELSEEGSFSDTDLFVEQLSKLQASDEVKEKINKEIKRFQKCSDSSSESAVERGYIETLLELPWDKVSEDNLDINRAEAILDENHYGLEKVKERILEFLAVRKMTGKTNSSIICLVGPPGTGKTSIAKSVAQALDKKYTRICLGGVRDEAEIRGHRRTYVGAMPGRIVGALKQAGVKNPLMLLDEIDKVSNDYKGDTFSALLEVLDPDQNEHFRDHYIEIPVDLSQVLFLATANSVSTIPRPLLDRMEVIEVSGYTENEKFHIAKEHLLKKQYEQNGMTKKNLSISDKALQDMIRFYTREAGVRELERKTGEICRKAARRILQSDLEKISVTGANLPDFLGKHKYSLQMANKKDEIGIARGLAWTAVGGETLQIEVNMMPGKGEIELTGQMGDVMKESAHIGISYIRAIGPQYDIKPEIFKKYDFHIHIPEGAVPKDGPSAGITMATAILSAILRKKVRAKVAMTGEITLRGNVLPIGGLKEKLLAAKMAGIETVLVPKENEKDVLEISKEITEGMEIVFVSHMKEVMEQAFTNKGKVKHDN